jgi:hypothetical protein
MGFFSFIENFFFVTLAITFVLILLLVYHFKQRINYTEEKMEKMFEIVNNIVKELGAVKNIALRNHLGENLGFPEGIVQKVPLFDNITFAINNQHVNENTRNSHTPFEIIEEEDEDEDEEDEDEDEGEEDEDEGEDEGEDEDVLIISETLEDESLDVDVIASETPEPVIFNTYTKPTFLAPGTEPADLTDKDNSYLTVSKHVPLENYEGTHFETKEVKLENTKPTLETTKESYRKMNLTQLKTILLAKGYAEDTSKLKKHDLIKILETVYANE